MTAPKLLFVEFGVADFSRFRQAVADLSLRFADVSKQVGPEAGIYAPVERGLDEAMEALLGGASVCISLTPKESEIQWVLLFAPNVMEHHVSVWNGMLELRSASYETVFDILKKAGLQYVAVAKDDPFDLTDNELQRDKFPWDSPNFVAAALADDTGYVERHTE
jgi:hypothetical protein